MSQSQATSTQPSQSYVGTPSSVASSRRGIGGSRLGTSTQTPTVMGTPRTPIIGSSQIHLPRSEFGRTHRTGQSQRYQFPPTPNSNAPSSPGEDDDGEDGDDGDNNIDLAGRGTVIWGTSVDVNSCVTLFRDFLNNFHVGNDFEPYYIRQLEIMKRTDNLVLNLNCTHLNDYPATKRFYKQLEQYPQEVLPILDMVLTEEYLKYIGEPSSSQRVQVRTFGLIKFERMRDLEPSHIDQLIGIKGMVIRCSQVIPELKQAYFRCFVCGVDIEVLIDRGMIQSNFIPY